MSKPLITLMRGLPRAGKSTWISKNKKPNDVIVSPDDVRKEIFGHQFFKPAESFVWGLTHAFITILMQQKKNIIVDATHLTHSAICQYNNLIEQYQYKTRLVWIKTDTEECLRRNEKTTKIPTRAMEMMIRHNGYLDDDYEMDDFDQVIVVENGKTIKVK